MESEFSSRIFEALWSLLMQLPSLLTMLGCIVFAFSRWQRHPKVSLAVLIGLGLLIAHMFVFAFAFAFVPDVFARPRTYSTTLHFVINIISFFYHSTLAIALGVILLAVFMKRNPSASMAETSATVV